MFAASIAFALTTSVTVLGTALLGSISSPIDALSPSVIISAINVFNPVIIVCEFASPALPVSVTCVNVD